MCYAYLRLFAASAIACGLFVPVAQAAPVANLPLTCPDAGAIGQTNCGGLVYQSPTPQLIVLKGPSSAATWARANSLTSSDTVAVCTLPVEPGTYSSCRDASGVRRLFLCQRTRFSPIRRRQEEFWCSCARPHESRGDK